MGFERPTRLGYLYPAWEKESWERKGTKGLKELELWKAQSWVTIASVASTRDGVE